MHIVKKISEFYRIVDEIIIIYHLTNTDVFKFWIKSKLLL